MKRKRYRSKRHQQYTFNIYLGFLLFLYAVDGIDNRYFFLHIDIFHYLSSVISCIIASNFSAEIVEISFGTDITVLFML